MNRAESAFPTELLEEIFSYLTRSELTRVCRVNRRICSASRTLLYSSIDLSSGDTYVGCTLRLLSTDEALGSRIQSAQLQTVPQPHLTTETWINTNIFKNWTRLKTLRLVGCPFRGTSMRQFQEVLREKCQLLSQIAFQPNADMEIAGIIGVQWGGQSTIAEFTLQPGFLLDTSSVTHLSFGGIVTHATNHPLGAIFQYSFPRLISLDLGSLAVCDEPDWSRRSLTQFLLNNPSIQHLSLGKERPIRDIFFDLHPPSLFPGFLPELRSFGGFPENMIVMARAQVQCLDRLQSLALVSAKDELQDMEAMFLTLSGRTLGSVQRLHVELYSELSHRMHSNVTFLSHINCMKFAFANLCPNVTEIFAKLAPMYGDMLGRLFSSYEHLESLSLPLLSLSLNMSANQIEFFGPIAQQCPKLQFIKARRPGLQNEDFVFSLWRGDDGNLVRVSRA